MGVPYDRYQTKAQWVKRNNHDAPLTDHERYVIQQFSYSVMNGYVKVVLELLKDPFIIKLMENKTIEIMNVEDDEPKPQRAQSAFDQSGVGSTAPG